MNIDLVVVLLNKLPDSSKLDEFVRRFPEKDKIVVCPRELVMKFEESDTLFNIRTLSSAGNLYDSFWTAYNYIAQVLMQPNQAAKRCLFISDEGLESINIDELLLVKCEDKGQCFVYDSELHAMISADLLKMDKDTYPFPNLIQYVVSSQVNLPLTSHQSSSRVEPAIYKLHS